VHGRDYGAAQAMVLLMTGLGFASLWLVRSLDLGKSPQ